MTAQEFIEEKLDRYNTDERKLARMLKVAIEQRDMALEGLWAAYQHPKERAIKDIAEYDVPLDRIANGEKE